MTHYTPEHVEALCKARKHLEQALAQLDTVPLANNSAIVFTDAKILTGASVTDAAYTIFTFTKPLDAIRNPVYVRMPSQNPLPATQISTRHCVVCGKTLHLCSRIITSRD